MGEVPYIGTDNKVDTRNPVPVYVRTNEQTYRETYRERAGGLETGVGGVEMLRCEPNKSLIKCLKVSSLVIVDWFDSSSSIV